MHNNVGDVFVKKALIIIVCTTYVLRMRIPGPQAMYNTNRLNSVKADTYFISVIGI